MTDIYAARNHDRALGFPIERLQRERVPPPPPIVDSDEKPDEDS